MSKGTSNTCDALFCLFRCMASVVSTADAPNPKARRFGVRGSSTSFVTTDQGDARHAQSGLKWNFFVRTVDVLCEDKTVLFTGQERLMELQLNGENVAT